MCLTLIVAPSIMPFPLIMSVSKLFADYTHLLSDSDSDTPPNRMKASHRHSCTCWQGAVIIKWLTYSCDHAVSNAQQYKYQLIWTR